MLKIGELEIAEEKGLEDVHVFQICECDAVAAYTLEEAMEWYKKETGVSDEELYSYDEIEIISPDCKVCNAENKDEMISVQEIINIHWNGEPFIALSTEW